MAAANIATMASGGASPTYKFYFFCQAADGSARALMETIVSRSTSQATVVVKAENSALGERLIPYFRNSLQQFAK